MKSSWLKRKPISVTVRWKKLVGRSTKTRWRFPGKEALERLKRFAVILMIDWLIQKEKLVVNTTKTSDGTGRDERGGKKHKEALVLHICHHDGFKVQSLHHLHTSHTAFYLRVIWRCCLSSCLQTHALYYNSTYSQAWWEPKITYRTVMWIK